MYQRTDGKKNRHLLTELREHYSGSVVVSKKQYEKFAIPFIETVPAANLLLAGGTVGSYTLFIFAICRIFVTTE
jgi:hypothetical protein